MTAGAGNRRAGETLASVMGRPMSKTILSLLTIMAVLALGFEASAQAKKCPKGYMYNPATGKCVPRRGSG